MNGHPLTDYLNQLAEAGVPSDLDLRAAVYRRLETSKTQSLKGAFSMKAGLAQPRRQAAVMLFGFLLLAAALLATPEGRAWAQDAAKFALRFFSRASSEVRPVPTLLPTMAAVATDRPATAMPTATRRASTILPFQDTCGSLPYAHCSMLQIRGMVDFPVMELAAPPEGWEFMGATGGPELVWVYYRGERGGLELSQGPDRYRDQTSWPVGGEAEVESVQIAAAGRITGEYVQGAWIDPGQNAGSVIWDGRITQRTLRWEDGGIRYTLRFMPAKTNKGILLEKAMLVDLAAHLTSEPAGETISTPTPNAVMEEVAAQADFPIQEPGWLPERYLLVKAAYAPGHQAVCLYYDYPESESAPYLVVVQTPRLLSLPDILMPPQYYNNGKEDIKIDIPVYSEQISLGGALNGQALYASNGVEVNSLCEVGDIITNHVLLWQSGGMSYVISGLLDAYEGRQFLTRLEMRRIAESLTGFSTIPAEIPDPEYLPSVEAAQSLAGFPVKAPSQMPADVRFAYAVYREAGAPSRTQSLADGGAEVVLVYFAPTSDSIERRHSYLIFENDHPTNTLEEMALGGGEWVSVHGQPAVFYQVCWDGSANGGDSGCNLSLSWVDENGIRLDLNAYLSGALDRQTFLGIAESMK
jgi:hypothetical protein